VASIGREKKRKEKRGRRSANDRSRRSLRGNDPLNLHSPPRITSPVWQHSEPTEEEKGDGQQTRSAVPRGGLLMLPRHHFYVATKNEGKGKGKGG